MGAKVYALSGGTVARDIKSLKQGGLHVVVGTPRCVYDMMKKGYFKADHVRVFVIDEADEMISRG